MAGMSICCSHGEQWVNHQGTVLYMVGYMSIICQMIMHFVIPKSEHHISLRLYPFFTYHGGSVPLFCSLSTTEMKIALSQIWGSLPDYA